LQDTGGRYGDPVRRPGGLSIVCVAFLALAACGGTDVSTPRTSPLDSRETSSVSDAETDAESGAESDTECAAPAVMELLERSSWFTADSFDVVSEPGGRLSMAIVDGATWRSGPPTFEDGEPVIVSMGPEDVETAIAVGATFATTGPVPTVIQAFQVTEDSVVVIDPTCSTAQRVLDDAQVALGVSSAEMLELLMTDDGRAAVLSASS
jgi:hypothetical protein